MVSDISYRRCVWSLMPDTPDTRRYIYLSYQVAMKKKPANHVKDLAEGESGSQLSKEGDDLLTAINM